MTTQWTAPQGATAGVRDPLLGRVLDRRYLITGRIARGGMATVYAATDRRLDRTVAVKVMHPGLGDDQDFAARFVAEARAAARLSHPNVVAVFDQGTDDTDGQPTVFLAMELVSGHTLRDTIVREAPLSPARSLALLEPTVSALAAAHRAGLIHRDVKPENVLIADDGRIKVADFGLAKAVSSTTQHTATGVLIGTVSYVAPELVVEGRSDARADVYAVGVILYELLTGRKPHQGETPIQVAYRHVHHDVPPPSHLQPGIPAYVDALVARATARDREQRPADAGVLLHQLRRVAQALAAGVRDDSDLVADLALHRRSSSGTGDTAEVLSRVEPTAVRGGTRDLAGPLRQQPQPARQQFHQPARQPAPASRRPGRPRAPAKKRQRGPLVLALALVAAVAVGAGAWWFGYARYTPTPGVLGLTQGQATQRLEAAGLDVSMSDPVYSSTVPKGRVLATDPSAGDRVLGGGAVQMTLSRGVEAYQLPTLAGMGEDDAQDAIAGVKMSFGSTARTWSETVARGEVISSDPAAGTTLRPGAIVDLVVSRGRKPVRLDSWVGKDAGDAADALLGQGLTVDRDEEEYSDTVPAGAVISQTPAGGTLHLGDSVSLIVSRGPELVTVPGVRAHGVDSATQELEGLGFQVKIEHATGYLGLGFVFSTDPAAGTDLPKGSVVTLYLI